MEVGNSINGIMGLAIGDALGVPNEFCVREKLMNNPVTEMIGYKSHNVPKGTWSDDTSMTLATIDSIVEKGRIDTDDMASKFLEWMKDAKYASTNECFDIGRTTLQALARFESKIDKAENCGGKNEMENGNGSLMRILPVAYYCYYCNYNEDKIYDVVKQVSSITHAHEVSILGCYIYVMYAISLLKENNKTKSYNYIKSLNYKKISNETLEKYKRILKNNISKYDLSEIQSTGYVVSTLEATFWLLLNTKNYNEAVIGAVNLGNDTDTIGACTGGLAGILYGVKNIRDTWKIDLKGYNYIKKLCQKFDFSLASEVGTVCLFCNKYDTEKKKKIKIEKGNILDYDVDCIVNPSNNNLMRGSGLCGQIFQKAGDELDIKCKELESCLTGEAKITKGYNLKQKYIVHTVAPKWYENNDDFNKENLLKNCYINSLALAKDFEIKKIAIPCIGTGIYKCPIDVGAKCVHEAIKQYIEYFDKIYLVCYSDEQYVMYKREFKDIGVK